MKRSLPRIWLITDRVRTAGDLPTLLETVLPAAPAGTTGIILREKDLSGRPLLELAKRIRQACPDSCLVINGRLDVALACGADGVHLGGDAPALEDVRALAGDLWLGVSVHDGEPIPLADYALLSPVFETRSKPGSKPLGLEAFSTTTRSTRVSVFALGGIDADNAAACLAAGAAGVAVREAVLLAPDPAKQLEKMTRALGLPNGPALS